MIRGESARMWGATAGTAILGTVLLLGGALLANAHGGHGTRGSNAAGTAHPALEARGVTFEFVRIEPGRFRMGSEEGDPDERPARQVGIGYAFEMGRTEVTVRQFRAFVEATGYRTVAEREGAAWHMWSPEGLKWSRRCHWRKLPFEQTDDDPVVCISYLDAVVFCKWLSAETGRTIRLPTEAEWEYACRAGTAATDAGDLEAAAWFDRNSGARPHRVGRKMPNPWGLHDMHGNVAEWCADAYRWHYRDAPIDGRPFIAVDVPAPAAVRRVLRGVPGACHRRSAGRPRDGLRRRPCGPPIRAFASSAGACLRLNRFP